MHRSMAEVIRLGARAATVRDLGGGDPMRDDLGVHLQLAHASGDQLGVLGTEVDDEHLLFGTGHDGSTGGCAMTAQDSDGRQTR